MRQRPSSVVRTADFCFGRQHDSCARLRKFDRDNRRETPEMIFLALQESNYEQARAHTSIAARASNGTVTVDRQRCLTDGSLTSGRCGNRSRRSADRNVRNPNRAGVRVPRAEGTAAVVAAGPELSIADAAVGCTDWLTGLSARELSDSLVRCGSGRNLRCGNDCCVLVLCVFVLTVGRVQRRVCGAVAYRRAQRWRHDGTRCMAQRYGGNQNSHSR